MLELQDSVRGQVVLPQDGSYDQLRRVWNGMIDRRPSVIVRAVCPTDVMNAVKYAKRRGLSVCVRGGGHGVAGEAVCDGGLMIDLSLMKSIRVYPKRNRARAEPGLNWGEFDRETQAFGLATTGSMVSTTGIAGYTLGGGIGWLLRKHGLGLDNLVSTDVVTADGDLLMASSGENPQLFWGLRGGGGNFGVVTSFEYQLHPVGPTVLGGMLVYRAEDAGPLLRFYREFIKEAPTELTTLFLYPAGTPTPLLPLEVQGERMIAIALCYAGAIEEGERLLAPLKKFGSPVADFVRPIPYLDLQSMFDYSARSGAMNYWMSSYIDGLSDSAIETITACGEKASSPMSTIRVYQLGGNLTSSVDLGTSFNHRYAPFLVSLAARWDDSKANEKHIAWVRESSDAIRKFATGTCINFMGDEEGDEELRAAYGEEKLRMLVALKDKYDPDNMFRFNHNVQPSHRNA